MEDAILGVEIEFPSCRHEFVVGDSLCINLKEALTLRELMTILYSSVAKPKPIKFFKLAYKEKNLKDD